jgi:hypothetical protein
MAVPGERHEHVRTDEKDDRSELARARARWRQDSFRPLGALRCRRAEGDTHCASSRRVDIESRAVPWRNRALPQSKGRSIQSSLSSIRPNGRAGQEASPPLSAYMSSSSLAQEGR